MHDVSRDALYRKQWEQKKHTPSDIPHPHVNDHDQGQPHDHHHHDTKQADEGHDHHHLHDDHGHSCNESDHVHDSDHNHFHHQHVHKHVYYHTHAHRHDRVRRTLMHRVFRDPIRDWFGLGLILLFIVIGFFRIFPDKASQGLFLSAALIGLFPAMKNAIRASLLQKKTTLELPVVALLLILLFSGHFFETALASLFLLAGSFLHLDFSWHKD